MNLTSVPDIIDSFKDEYEKFSNFYPVLIHFEGMNFQSVEHAYVASKTKDRMIRQMISKLDASEAGKAKMLGRKLILREDWHIIKIALMKKFLMEKYLYKEFKDFLLSTGNSQLIEGNHWHDNYWGNCYCKKCCNVVGQNNLGKILMKIRDTIK